MRKMYPLAYLERILSAVSHGSCRSFTHTIHGKDDSVLKPGRIERGYRATQVMFENETKHGDVRCIADASVNRLKFQ